MEVLIVGIVFGSMFGAFALTVLAGTSLVFAAMHLVAQGVDKLFEVRRFEAEARLEQARMKAGLPLLIDRSSAAEVSAWNRAVKEVYS